MHNLTIRFGGFYSVMFLIVGIQMPYWPLWLQDQGMNTSQIGILVATLLWVKVAFNPIAGHLVDATGKRRAVLCALTLGALIGYIGFTVSSGFIAFLLLSIFTGSLFAALLPIADNLTMTYVVRHNMDYGRIRLWGSLGFIVSSVSVGRLIDEHSPSLVIWLIIAAMLPLSALTLSLPETLKQEPTGEAPLRWADLLQEPRFWIFLTATAMTGASHALYYGFASLHWLNIGIGHTWIGFLWGIAVAAEVALFAFSRRVVQAVGIYTLLIIGCMGAVIRWIALAHLTDPILLIPVQCLHALSFGAVHLAAMHFIARHMKPEITGRAQGLFAAMGNGVVLGMMTFLSAPLFELYGGGAFWIMATSACVGLGFAIWLRMTSQYSKGSRIFRESL